ncbi:uncharacterized protein [Amphiura filiformis]|uniref:uncharacterized protein n=1 Tax=Amphiura filiformis TaxID=82378 RepID=UPI003B2182AC
MASKCPVRISYFAKKELGKLLNPSSNADWRIFAGLLGCSDLTIQNYEARNGANVIYNATVEILREWEHVYSGHPPAETLQEKLEQMGRYDAIGVIESMLADGTFYDDQAASPSSLSSSGRSPNTRSCRPSFPASPAIRDLQAQKESDMFSSDLTKGSGREPTEDSYNSLSSMDGFPTRTDPPVVHNKPDSMSNSVSVRPKEVHYNNNSDLATRPVGIPPPLPPNLTENFTCQHKGPMKRDQSHQMSQKGAPTRQTQSPVFSNDARPKTNQNYKTLPSNTEPSNMRRTCSWENTSSSTSSSSSSSPPPHNSNTWPAGKENPIKWNSHPHMPGETTEQVALPQVERIPGDYHSGQRHQFKLSPTRVERSPRDYHPEQRQFNSWPMDPHQRVDSMWPSGDYESDVHRRRELKEQLDVVSKGVSAASQQCITGKAYGITFAWKDWRCGMQLAKKLKRDGHHVEIDRKRSWYQDEQERNRKLGGVFNSVTYIIVIYTPNYVQEIRNEVHSPINTRFLYEYMETEYNDNKKRNTRFIPIVDESRIQHPDPIFKEYPVDQHRYIVHLIRQPGVVVERQISLN